jgi:hypothetical protein
MKEHLLEWLLRFGTRDDVTWREAQISGLARVIDFGYMQRKGYLRGTHGRHTEDGSWRYHLTDKGLEYINETG